MYLIGGIDEAGRGCVIGPMVMYGVCVSREREPDLQRIGVKDSKQLSPQRREKLAKLIREIVHSVKEVIISPQEIDLESLNVISLKKSSVIINSLNPDLVFLDAPVRGSGLQKYHRSIQWLIENKEIEICAENKADEKYPTVAAASILAKVKRDAEIHNLRKIYGDFGSGYPSDPKTKKFIQKYLSTDSPFPSIFRLKWATLRRTYKKVEQKNILEDL